MDFRNFLTITRFAIQDELHNKSFYVLTAVSMLFVFLLRGCFHSNFVVNGQQVDSATIGYNVSIIAFNIIASAGMLMAVLLAMRVFKRDRDNGMAVTILSKPVRRIEYIAGKIAGVWLLAYCLIFILHATVYIIMLLNTGGRIPFFLPASLITSVNVLFMVTMVMLFSMIMPDVIAAILTIAIALVSLTSDSIYAVSRNPAVQSMIGQQDMHVSLWRVIWPKLAALQFFSTSLIKENPFQQFGPVHPVLNIALYCVIGFALLYYRFAKEELQ